MVRTLPVTTGGQDIRVVRIPPEFEVEASVEGSDMRSGFVEDCQESIDGIRVESHTDGSDQHENGRLVGFNRLVERRGNDTEREGSETKNVASNRTCEATHIATVIAIEVVESLRVERITRPGAEPFKLPSNLVLFGWNPA